MIGALAQLGRSLRARLILGLLLVGLVGALGMAGMAELQRHSATDALEDTSLATQARVLIGGIQLDDRGRFVGVKIRERWRKAYATPGAGYFTVFDPQGAVVARSSNLATPLQAQPLVTGKSLSALSLVGPQEDLSLTARGPRGYMVVVARSSPGRLTEARSELFNDFQPLILLLTVLGFVMLAAWLVAGWSLRPLARASREASAIGPASLDDRITLVGLPSEVVPMAHAVNGALDRVSRAYAAERNFTSDAAHALRTPVAVMDLRLQRARTTGQLDLDALRGDLREIAELAAGLLNLARVEQGSQPQGQLNLARLVRECAAEMQPAYDEKGRTLKVDAPDNLQVPGNGRALRDAVKALFDNALHHGAGPVVARVAAEEGGVWIDVQDQGGGVKPDRQEAVFERFKKLDANSHGAGLGLAIVRQTARAHGGDAFFVAPATIRLSLA